MTEISNELKTTGLSKSDIAALKQGDSICLHHRKGNVGQVRAIKRKKDGTLWTSNGDNEREIGCSSSIRSWSEREQLLDGKHCTAYHYINYAQYDEIWRTVVSLLRVGDELHIEWISSSNSYLKWARIDGSAGDGSDSARDYAGLKLYHDRVYLRVRRGGESKYYFMLSDSICPNNSARTIQGL